MIIDIHKNIWISIIKGLCPLWHSIVVFLSRGGGFSVGFLDRDTQHRPLTRNATKGEKGGSKLYILPNFDKK